MCLRIYMPPNVSAILLVSRRSNAIPRYFIRTHTVSPRELMGSIYAHSYGQFPFNSAQCIQSTGYVFLELYSFRLLPCKFMDNHSVQSR